jgi:pyruvate formate lyase activating enzyme
MLNVARFYVKISDQDVQSLVSTQECAIRSDERGNGYLRRNAADNLMSENVGFFSYSQSDWIEKGPFLHFCRGSNILPIGSIGCDLKSNFCHNCEICQTAVDGFLIGEFSEPMDVVAKAKAETESVVLAFIYNGPTAYYEIMHETTQKSTARGMNKLMASKGFIQRELLLSICLI